MSPVTKDAVFKALEEEIGDKSQVGIIHMRLLAVMACVYLMHRVGILKENTALRIGV